MALVDDYDVVVVGLAHLLDPYASRVVVAGLDTNQPVVDDVDVVLCDTFAQPEADQGDLDVLVRNPRARHVAVYTWNFHPALVDAALGKGVHGYLSKTLPARELVTECMSGCQMVPIALMERCRLHPAWPACDVTARMRNERAYRMTGSHLRRSRPNCSSVRLQ